LYSHNALCDGCTMFAQHPCDESTKNRKIEKKQKNTFFVNFLYVSNQTCVKNENLHSFIIS
jgi:hypothetical protein